MDSRLPKLIFTLLVLYAVIHFSFVYPQLPAVTASHFDARGTPNGWQTKQAFLGVFIVVSFIAALVGFGIPRLIGGMPASLINLPYKSYWFAPERIAETREYLKTYFAWFGCAVFVVVIMAFDYAVQINLHPQSPPSPSRMWYILAGFLVFSVVSSARMMAKLLRPPQGHPAAR